MRTLKPMGCFSVSLNYDRDLLEKLNVLINEAELTGGQYVWTPDIDFTRGTYSIQAEDVLGIYFSVSFGLTNNTAGISVSTPSQVSVAQSSIRLYLA